MKIKARRVIPLHEVPATFYSPERDGVTFSLLTAFKQCREKARLILNGWTSKSSGLGLVFGSLVHGVNQRIYDDVRAGRLTSLPDERYIKDRCRSIELLWKQENPLADAEALNYLEASMIYLEAVMPLYFKYWAKDFTWAWSRVEKEFKIPFTIRSGVLNRTVETFIRGKIDGAFAKKKGQAQHLFETKSKAYLGERGESDLADILPHELQVNIYLLYLWWTDKQLPGGVLYNIIRRPGQRQKKNESLVKYARRIASDVRLRPEYYFIRMRMLVSKRDLEKQELELRDMVSDFIMWWHGHSGHYKNSDSCQNKYGVCQFLPVCSRGDYSGFYRRTTVFRELADEL